MTTGSSRLITGIVVLLLLIGGFLYYSKYSGVAAITSFDECKAAGYQIMESYPEQCRTPDGRTFINTTATSTQNGTVTPTPTGKENLIRVTSVVPNQIVTSPLIVSGQARGTWYFEASFPVELLDGNGKRLGIAPAQAQGEWMTGEFVPYSVSLSFAQPTTATGSLILHKDNPSGLPQNDDQLRIPVRFSATERTIKLYYYNPNLDKNGSGTILCSSQGLVAVDRVIPVTQSPLKDAITLLLRGELTTNERTQGVTTEFPLPSVTLNNASISNSGVAAIAISDPLNRTSGGACRAQVLRAQVEATVRQFSNIKSVTFTPATLFQP